MGSENKSARQHKHEPLVSMWVLLLVPLKKQIVCTFDYSSLLKGKIIQTWIPELYGSSAFH